MPRLLRGVDGKLEIDDLVVALSAMVTTAVAIFVTGTGVELFAVAFGLDLSSNRLLYWAALGLLVGGLIATWRVIVDLLFDKSEKPATISVHSGPDGVQERVPAPASLTYGVEVYVHQDNKIYMARLLENKERVEAVVMLRRVAGSIIHDGTAFSKRGAARFLGENATAVRDELVRLGLMAKQGSKANSTFGPTTAGTAFFQMCLMEPFPDDPITVKVE